MKQNKDRREGTYSRSARARLGVVGMATVVLVASAGSWSQATASPIAKRTAAGSISKASPALSGVLRIAFVCATASQQPFFVPIQRGAEAAAKAMGVTLSYTGLTQPDGFTVSNFMPALQVAITQKPNAIIACDFFPSSEDPVLKAAADKGIPIFISNSPSTASSAFAVASFAESNYTGGFDAAQMLASEGVKKAVCVNDNPANLSVVARCNGFLAGAKTVGLKGIVDTLPPGDSSDAPLETAAVKGALASDPAIGGFLMMGPVQGPAAVLGIQQAGLAGKVKVGTFDLSSTVLSDVGNGSIAFGIWQEPYLQGYLPVQAAANYLRYGMSPTGTVGTGPVFVTEKNVAAVKYEVATFGG